MFIYIVLHIFKYILDNMDDSERQSDEEDRDLRGEEKSWDRDADVNLYWGSVAQRLAKTLGRLNTIFETEKNLFEGAKTILYIWFFFILMSV